MLPPNKQLRTIFNNDINNILGALDPEKTAPEIAADYRRALGEILDAGPGVFAQNVGMPDPVIYDSAVATHWHSYFLDICREIWPDADPDTFANEAAASAALTDAANGPFLITIEECRKRGVMVVADYRMNAEDWYHNTYRLSDFGREHPQWRIPLTEEEKQRARDAGGEPPEFAGCLDPAVPEVYAHRLAIFREVAERYDIDGIEFDFRRWCHMISSPLENHHILTRMVAETRRMLDQVAAAKGRDRLLLGVRVGPALDTPQAVAAYPGAVSPGCDKSCTELGLDVRTWIEQELVDYVCPTLYWPRWPGLPHTQEFAELAAARNVGIYPTLFPLPAWLEQEPEETRPLEPGQTERLTRYRNEFRDLALALYAHGADGISTFNWYFHLHLARMPHQWQAYYGYGMGGAAIQKQMLAVLGDPDAIRCCQQT